MQRFQAMRRVRSLENIGRRSDLIWKKIVQMRRKNSTKIRPVEKNRQKDLSNWNNHVSDLDKILNLKEKKKEKELFAYIIVFKCIKRWRGYLCRDKNTKYIEDIKHT